MSKTCEAIAARGSLGVARIRSNDREDKHEDEYPGYVSKTREAIAARGSRGVA